MPLDHLAASEYSCALDFRPHLCRGELRDLPYHGGLVGGGIRSQRNGIYADRSAYVSIADALRVLPCEQQLLA